MNKLNKFVCGIFGAALSASLLSACAGEAPAVNNDPARERAHEAYNDLDKEVGEPTVRTAASEPAVNESAAQPAVSMQLSNASFKTTPTVLVSPAVTGRMTGSIDVVRRNPLAKTAMEVINAYLTSRGYSVVGLESQAQLDEVVELENNIAGNDEDLSYVAGLSVGADISVTYAGSIQDGDVVVDLNASEASTASLLASESVKLKVEEGESQRALVQKAMNQAIVGLENKIRDRLAAELEKGVMYKVVAHLTGEFTDDQAEEISNIVSTQVRKKFNKMQILSMSRNTYDLIVYADPDKYDDAQMVYGEFVESLSGLAKVRKQNIAKKLIILEIQ